MRVDAKHAEAAAAELVAYGPGRLSYELSLPINSVKRPPEEVGGGAQQTEHPKVLVAALSAAVAAAACFMRRSWCRCNRLSFRPWRLSRSRRLLRSRDSHYEPHAVALSGLSMSCTSSEERGIMETGANGSDSSQLS